MTEAKKDTASELENLKYEVAQEMGLPQKKTKRKKTEKT
ncbi:small, acid-soluble spore protein, alpha/beta type [Dehalobacter sp. TBBPA1]